MNYYAKLIYHTTDNKKVTLEHITKVQEINGYLIVEYTTPRGWKRREIPMSYVTKYKTVGLRP